MANKKAEEFKLKERFTINIESRSDEKKRKFTQWINAQSNAQNSILSMIEHLIDRFGYVDVTDHEIAKKLYTEALYFENKPVQIQSSHENKPEEINQIEQAVTERETNNTLKVDLNNF